MISPSVKNFVDSHHQRRDVFKKDENSTIYSRFKIELYRLFFSSEIIPLNLGRVCGVGDRFLSRLRDVVPSCFVKNTPYFPSFQRARKYRAGFVYGQQLAGLARVRVSRIFRAGGYKEWDLRRSLVPAKLFPSSHSFHIRAFTIHTYTRLHT